MFKKILFSFFILLILAVLFYWYEVNTPLNNREALTNFKIEKGQSVKQISRNLKEKNLIKSDFFFNMYVWLKDKQRDFKAGDYIVSPSYSIKEIVNNLTNNPLSDERTITIIEGWGIKEIDKYLKENKIAQDNNFLKLANNKLANWNFNFSKPEFFSNTPKEADLEGYLFPDTYRIFKDATSEEIIKKMLDNFNKKITDQIRADIKVQKRSIHEIITMASLIEKEVRTFDDMKIVSGIFWDRIKNSQALESCASIAYILGEKKIQYSYEDTRIKSPYNTYINPGLPPGPICNPGLNAIKAAIYPTASENNYFLSRPDTGETIFSKSLEEHNRNKAKYLGN